ncbi:lactonase family protein [Paenibacillus sp. NFR01]|uniref:lactonase family protein n=1 Tax=Paenibacillus sp. NFR01 TaxID=1566279 RepID=UPI0008C6C857|nr:lactonase family protein [Paenibacillus sp. NFR01]SET35571.1 6-phosphogluconolactonase [Paenibacillus sp. NFR01]
MSEQSRLLIFTGSYAAAGENGVQVYAFDPEAGGRLDKLSGIGGITNPTFVNVDPDHKRLYAIGEQPNGEGGKAGEVAAYAIDVREGTLAELNRIPTMPAEGKGQTTTCHINRDKASEFLLVSSYHGGKVGLLTLDAEGRPEKLADTAVHNGAGATPQQDRPHPHSAIYSPDERYVFVSDLGLDLIRTYRIDKEARKLEVVRDTKLHPGAGPRHFIFHPDGRSAYVINEIECSITSFRYHAEEGMLETVATVSTLPEGVSAENNACAEIAISEDGRYIYGSNRGDDSIVVFAVDAEMAKLTLVEHVKTRGGHPRHFALLPGGAFLIVANRDGNNLVVFAVDRKSGKLTFTGHTAEQSKPVCVKPAVFGLE